MKFIRENLFYLLLVVSVLVLSGVLLGVDSSLSDDVTTEITDRKNLSDQLMRFTNPASLVNPAIVAAEANRVRLTWVEANKVVDQQRAKNRTDYYKVLLLPVIGPSRQVIMQQPAFPYDSNMYREYDLVPQFVVLHRAAFQERLAWLEPTRPPTLAEFQVVLGELEVQNPSGGAGAQAALNQAKAQDYAIYERATAGRMYVDELNIAGEVTLPDGLMTASPSALWIKQYKLWIATDLFIALKAANEEVLGALPNRQGRNVLNAPVKRLMSLRIADAYSSKPGQAYTGAPEAGGGIVAPGPAPMRGPAAGGGPGPMMGPGPMRGPVAGGGGMPSMGGMGGPAAGGGAPAPAGGADVQASAETVTQHYTDGEKDVIQYTFQVIMPTRQVPLVMRAIMRDRDHTVLSYKAQEDPRTLGYFYGNEPVMLVTFTCEAVFFTSWERDYVPPAFLRTLPVAALRDIDKERLK